MQSTQEAQEAQATAETAAALQKMLLEVKKKLKGESKNELIRIVGALLVDNYALKMQLAQFQTEAPASEQEKTNE